ncbi:DUF397 domain-containing protein [Streptomyces sp. B1I3]|uniref:DUF397 domain-containing protein n=1 Tax=Streptomyces sp. B1I3 TaxID=3042264 RepID=UPI00277FFEDE|nr:DUF397 domain-containing protein [Streptomyces sp. B1I3]MDQ0796187.1 hypothetical protein [Streptomyces sp. B1I3]
MTTPEPVWSKSSYSGTGGDNCVEVAVRPEAVLVRDSKDTQRHALTISARAWAAFTVLAADSRV